MNVQSYAKLPYLDNILLQRYRQNPTARDMKWVVMEMLDGDHLALYANAQLQTFKAATRKRFLAKEEDYSDCKETIAMHRDWVVRLSTQLKRQIIVYGKMVGGHYKEATFGKNIKTVCEYMPHNDFIVHDIKTNEGFLSHYELLKIADINLVTLTPTLYEGKLDEVIKCPANQLSTIPFLHNLAVNYKNEMKGIVIKPKYELKLSNDRVIFKRLNKRYIGKEVIKPRVEITEALLDIAAIMHQEAMTLDILDSTIIEVGGLSHTHVNHVAGLYVSSLLDIVNYIKYNILTVDQKRIVNSELNRLALLSLRTLLKAA